MLCPHAEREDYDAARQRSSAPSERAVWSRPFSLDPQRSRLTAFLAARYNTNMAKSSATHSQSKATRLYSGADVPMSVIRRFARQVAKRFQPDKIILFGSHAYGQPHTDSDVDILVVMPTRNTLDQAVKIDLACDRQFPLDLIVCKPRSVTEAMAGDDYFLEEILTKGKVLYEKGNQAMDRKGGGRLSCRRDYRQRAGRSS
jgi:uncharacterized protein